MIPLSISGRQQIYLAARSQFPNEACGVILNNTKIIALDNLSPTPQHNFLLPNSIYQMQGVTHIWHSHTNGNPSFSLHDIRVALEIGEWDWYLVSITDDTIALGDAAEDYLDVRSRDSAPYIGRQWRYGWDDCGALVRDFYRREYNINVPDFDRGEEYEWQEAFFRIFTQDNLCSIGFVRIEDKNLRKGDLLAMQLQGAPNPNHVGIVCEINNGQILFLHHLCDRLSGRDIYGGYWQKHCPAIYRHQSLC